MENNTLSDILSEQQPQEQQPQQPVAPINAAEELLVKEDYKRIIENLLFITDRPLSAAKISQVAEVNNIQLTRDIIGHLQQEYADTARAIQIVELGGGFQMATKPEYGRWVRKLFNEKMTAKLSPAALETLAIIAYKQPVTRAEIEAIRGVDIVAPLEKIMERGLVKIVGKKDTPGRPMVYGTTEEFLRLFGLNKISELPEIKTFSAKGPKEIQGDLPFSEALPDIKDTILPLNEGDEDEYLFSPQQEIFTKAPSTESEEESSHTVHNIAQEPTQEQQPAAKPEGADEAESAAHQSDKKEGESMEVIPGGMQVENLKDLNS